MVNTRKLCREREQEQKSLQNSDRDPRVPLTEDCASNVGPSADSVSAQPAKSIQLEKFKIPKVLSCTLNKEGSEIKSEPTRPVSEKPILKGPGSHRSQASSKSSNTKEIMKRKLLLEAEKRKAQIKMDLIDREIELKLAELDDENDPMEYSSQIGETVEISQRQVEKWVEKHQTTFEKVPQKDQLAPDHGEISGQLYKAPSPAVVNENAAAHASGAPVPPIYSTSNNTVEMLAVALKNLTTASTPNASLLSRMCTPKDLPEFAGDPLEWLQFKQAYEESTDICKFSEKENLWRLRKCLKGSAKEAVSALFISATSPVKVMSTLELRFGNPDCIISRITYDLKKLPPLHQDYQKDIVAFAVKVQNFVAAVQAIGRQEYLYGVSIVSIILSKLPTVLVSKWSDYSYNLITAGNKPRLLIMAEFLHEEAVKVSTTASVMFTNTRQVQTKGQNEYTTRSHTFVLQDSETKCQFCRKSVHKLTECKQFKKALRKVRWQYIKRSGLCYRCLLSRHERDTCPAPLCDKDNGQPHHRLLHYTVAVCHSDNNYQRPTQSVSIATDIQEPEVRCPPSSSRESAMHITTADRKVLLKVVPIRIHGPNGIVSSSALLDDGSTVSFISAELAQRAGLRGRRETMHVRGAWTDNELVCDTTIVNVNLSGVNNKVYNIRARCINELNLPLQKLSIVNCNNYNHLLDIKNVLSTTDSKPEMLIGQDNYHLLLPLEIKLGKLNEPSATLTRLGWCIHGCVSVSQRARPRQLPVAATFFVSENTVEPASDEIDLQRLHEEVRRSFTLDSVGILGKPRQNVDDVHAIAQLESTSRLIDDRWYVGLPWKDEKCKMPDSYAAAAKRLNGLENKMKKDSDFANRYRERVQHLLDNGFARELKETKATSRTWYLPHFGVDNPYKKKLRLVFDAAATVKGTCLNDYLLTGPDLLSSLFGIMLRFRENKIAVTGDIKDMFLRIKIHEEDQQALRFLWRNSPAEDIKTYAMTSLIFGANCSPFIAQFIKNKNAERYASTVPAAVHAIRHSHYMDDYIDSVPDDATAIEMVKNITNIHRSGGFEIRNWTSNSVAVLDTVPEATLGTAAVKFKIDQQYEGERTLGLIWYPKDDVLGFDVSLKRIPENIIHGKERPTKRQMLRIIMSIFDVLGFLSPFTIQGRIMLQDTWRLNIGWDEYISDEIYSKWCKWIDSLVAIRQLRIPRYHQAQTRATQASEMNRESKETIAGPDTYLVHHDSPAALGLAAPTPPHATSYNFVTMSTSATSMEKGYNNLQLHVFSDASSKAMCAVAYWRWNNNDKTYVSFIASKCRVTPVKPITVPKAELEAARLAARLSDNINKEHRLTPTARYFWCDSTTVIHWIRNNTRKYKTFEANRLGEIDDLTRIQEWRFVPTKLNVADLATRESFDYSVFNNEWFTGPNFLYKDMSLWPPDVLTDNFIGYNLESTAVAHTEPTAILPVPDALRFASWLRLVRATAMALRFVDKCKGLLGDLNCSMMERAERLLLKSSQVESFPTEVAALTRGRPIHRTSKLLTLSPFMDEDGLLRVAGRINAAKDVDQEVKSLVILDGRHPVARLIVRHFHVKAAHGNQETVVNELKQRYWMLKLRPTVKNVVSQCMLCRIRKCKPQVPRMGDLPFARMAHHNRPFTFCGLDLFGPMEVTEGRRRVKRYGVLFTCMTVRAIHIEIVSSLTTDSLIVALRRMASRRGWPRHLYSDNGTNMRGADKELQKYVRDLDTELLKNEGINNGMDWTFIPPASPHWGGAWERLIRSVKTSLKVILNERAPKDEVLNTLMAEVENMVNSRPLMHVSVEAGDVESLTPNHFLIGTSLNLPIIGVFDDSDLYLRKQWRKSQRLADMYWRRWVREILPDLLPRRKWHEEQKPLQVGDLVLIVDPDSPRNMWPKGLITQIFPGKDGRVRLVEIKTRTGCWRRSAARVARITSVEECCASTGVGSVSDALK